jgi:hypothetical protein
MEKNSEAPWKLANSVIADFKLGSASFVSACVQVASAFAALEECAWLEDDFLKFVDQLAAEHIGPGRSAFLKKDHDGNVTFDGKLKAGVYFQLRSIGRSEGINTPEFIEANRIGSYATLYRLTVLYNVVFDKESGTAEKKREKASKSIMDLVKVYGAALTRRVVDESIVAAQLEYRSRAPIKPIEVTEADPLVASMEVKLSELLAEGARYDLLLITPTDEFLLEAEASSLGTLVDRTPYQELRKAKSEAILYGPGRHMAGLKKLADVSGDLTYFYCVRGKPDGSAIIDLSKEVLVFASSPFVGKATIAKGESANQFVQRVVAERAAISTKKLHLFADQMAEGWDCCAALRSVKGP